MSKLLSLEKIKFSYPSSPAPILKINSFALSQGEKVFIYGPSGCGKTTFLEILAGVLVPQSGSYTFQETNVTQLNASGRDQLRAAQMGYIFQSFNLIPYLNVEENIGLPLSLSIERRQKVSRESEKEEILRLADALGISQLLLRPVHELSVGQQQRVAVARALLGKPKLILADEPTSALDHDHRQKFIELLFQVCRLEQTSVLFVSHDRSLQNLFDRSVSMGEL
jgi:putative ABC transport system ATP-binding protein